jgi:hypothetical protein
LEATVEADLPLLQIEFVVVRQEIKGEKIKQLRPAPPTVRADLPQIPLYMRDARPEPWSDGAHGVRSRRNRARESLVYEPRVPSTATQAAGACVLLACHLGRTGGSCRTMKARRYRRIEEREGKEGRRYKRGEK